MVIQRFSLAFLVTLLVSATSFAGIIFQPTSVSSDRAVTAFGPIERLIDQSGLSAAYSSGVTDFDAFTAITTGFNEASGLVGLASPFPIDIDFTFSEELTVDRAAIWNQGGTASLAGFDLFASPLGTFTDLVFLGSFNAPIGGGLATVASFTPTDALGIRLTATSNYGFSGDVRFDEFAVGGVVSANAVPEPTSLVTFGLGALILSSTSVRRRRSKHAPTSP